MGTQVVQPVLSKNESAGVLAEVPRRAHVLLGQLQRQDESPIVGIEAEFFHVAVAHLFRPRPHAGRQRRDEVFWESERLADVADRPLALYRVTVAQSAAFSRV